MWCFDTWSLLKMTRSASFYLQKYVFETHSYKYWLINNIGTSTMAAAVLERQSSLLKTTGSNPVWSFPTPICWTKVSFFEDETKLSDHEDGYFDNYFLIVFHFSRFESFCFDRKLVKVVCNGCNGRSPVWPPWQKKIRGAAHLTGFLSLRPKLQPFFSLGGFSKLLENDSWYSRKIAILIDRQWRNHLFWT